MTVQKRKSPVVFKTPAVYRMKQNVMSRQDSKLDTYISRWVLMGLHLSLQRPQERPG